MIKVNKLDRVTLNLSQEYDNDANGIQFDVSEWVEKYGEGSVSLIHKRTGDTEPYIVLLDYEDGVATWTISDVDTAKDGIRGTAQLIYQVAGSGVVAHSPVARTVVLESNYDVSSTPDPYDNWIAELTALAGTTTANAASASASASSASASANTASAKATEASTSATSASASASSASASATSAETAKTEANQSKAAAKVSEDNAKASEELIEAYAERAESAATSASASATAAAASKDQASGLVNGFDTKVAGAIQNIDNKKTESVNAVDAKKAEGVSAVQAVIDTIPEDYTEALEDISELKNDLVDKANKVDLATANRKIKALTDIVNGQLMSIDTESYTSAKVDVPSGAVGDSVLKVGGKSVVMNQLHDNTIAWNKSNCTSEIIENGEKFTATVDNAVNVYLTNASSPKTISGHKYYVSFGIKPSKTITPMISLGWGSGQYKSVSATANIKNKVDAILAPQVDGTQFAIYPFGQTTGMNGETSEITNVMLIDLTQMGLADASLDECKAIFTADYYPYNAGTIVSSQTDKVTVRGKNLFDKSSTILDGYLNDGDGKFYNSPSANSFICEVEPNTTYTIRKGRTNRFICGTFSKIPTANAIGTVLFADASATTKTFTTDANAKILCIYAKHTSDTLSAQDIAGTIMVEKGTTATSYSPYSLNTITTSFPILKSAGSVRDEIDLASARPSTNDGFSLVDITRRIGSVDLGSLDWIWAGSGNGYSLSLVGVAQETNEVTDALSISYSCIGTSNTAPYWNRTADQIFYINTDGKIYLRDSRATDASTLKSLLNGVTLLYEKATPTTETLEIPNGLLEAINVESGGQLTFVDHNTSGIAMPISTTHEWIVRNEEV